MILCSGFVWALNRSYRKQKLRTKCQNCEKKIKLSDYVINNNFSLKKLKDNVKIIREEL